MAANHVRIGFHILMRREYEGNAVLWRDRDALGDVADLLFLQAGRVIRSLTVLPGDHLPETREVVRPE